MKAVSLKVASQQMIDKFVELDTIL